MKKCLQLSVLPLLLSAVLFCSCKDDNPGNPNPIVDASVQDAKVTIDQANKRIDVLFYEYNPLSAVEITFKFVDGAYLYTPLMKNPATLDLSNTKYGSTIVVQTGDDLVYYDVYGAVDYPIMGMVATADDGAIEGRVVFDQNTREITVEFNYVIDPTQVNCEFTLSPEGGKLIGLTNPCVLDMSKDQTITAESDKSGVAAVPRGRATSYGAVARALGRPGWARLVGRILGSCGEARIPAHRVVDSQGRLSGSHAVGSPSRMRELLESEGVQVAGDRIVGWRKVFWDPCKEIEMP